MSAIVCTLIAWLLCGCAAAQPEDRDIHDVLNRQALAWNEGDLNGFMQPYWHSDDLTFQSTSPKVDPDSGLTKDITTTTKGWQATLERYRARYPTPERMGRLSFTELRVTRVSPDAAVVSGCYHVARRDGDLSGRFFLDFRRIGEAWVIVHDKTVADSSS